MKNRLLLIFSLFIQLLTGQTFLNGNFEINAAGNTDQINLSNADCNLKLSNINSFGSYGDVDIITSSSYGGSGAQNGTWYLGLTGGATDIIALSISAPLTEGKAYTISFYDRKTNGYQVSPIVIGLSNANNTIGTIIYTAIKLAELNMWTQHTFTFFAPNNGSYITVQMQSGSISEWINVDNFVINPAKCGGELTIQASLTTINFGGTVTLTALGGYDYIWNKSQSLSSITESSIIVSPKENTVYSVISHEKGCSVKTATIIINVMPQEEVKLKDSITEENIKEIVIESNPKRIIDSKNKKKFFRHHKINGRKFFIQESISVSNNSVKILVWDKNRVDGDMVSIYINGELVLENLTVTKTKKEIIVDLEPGKNIIVMHALNLGLVPPNTAALSINDGLSRTKMITLSSDFKKSGALEIIYDPIAFNHN